MLLGFGAPTPTAQGDSAAQTSELFPFQMANGS